MYLSRSCISHYHMNCINNGGSQNRLCSTALQLHRQKADLLWNNCHCWNYISSHLSDSYTPSLCEMMRYWAVVKRDEKHHSEERVILNTGAQRTRYNHCLQILVYLCILLYYNLASFDRMTDIGPILHKAYTMATRFAELLWEQVWQFLNTPEHKRWAYMEVQTCSSKGVSFVATCMLGDSCWLLSSLKGRHRLEEDLLKLWGSFTFCSGRDCTLSTGGRNPLQLHGHLENHAIRQRHLKQKALSVDSNCTWLAYDIWVDLCRG